MTALVWGVSASLFLLGLAGVILRRQLMAMLLGLELMLLSANLALAYTANALGDPAGLAAALLVIAVGAAEAVFGLSLIIALTSSGEPAEAEVLNELKG